MSSPPVLAYADFKSHFILHIGASVEGLEDVLYQENDDLVKVVAAGVCTKQNRIIKPTNWNVYVLNEMSPKKSMVICMVIHFLFVPIPIPKHV